ncbi:hypothetical protein PROFUN_07543, partial [Planoprotostelium fungivorum]
LSDTAAVAARYNTGRSELLFARLKGKIRGRASDRPILGDLIREVARVTTADVAKMYKHCNLVG